MLGTTLGITASANSATTIVADEGSLTYVSSNTGGFVTIQRVKSSNSIFKRNIAIRVSQRK